MRTRTSPGRLVSTLVGLGVVGFAWCFFAPVALGGSTTYVVTEGVSMQPRFHSGDLAIVRPESSYRVGDIVAYRSQMLQTIVLHRIIARDGSRYVFKGDNNDFVDQEHPTARQLVGKLGPTGPRAGRARAWLGRPATSAVGSGVAAVLVLGSGFGVGARRRRRPGDPPEREPRGSPLAFDAAKMLLGLGLVGAAVFGLL